MKQCILLILSAFTSLFFYSCRTPCECIEETGQNLELKLLDSQRRNLVFGPQALYNVDCIKVLKNRGDFSIHNASIQKALGDSIAVRLNFYIPAAKSFLYFNQQINSDSLEVRWIEKKAGVAANHPPIWLLTK